MAGRYAWRQKYNPNRRYPRPRAIGPRRPATPPPLAVAQPPDESLGPPQYTIRDVAINQLYYTQENISPFFTDGRPFDQLIADLDAGTEEENVMVDCER
jgi:hypothetical protein